MNGKKISGRKYRRRVRLCILQSLPSVLLVIAVVSLVWAGWRMPRAKLTDMYKTEARRAIRREDWESAELCLRRLAFLDETDAETQYSLAIVAEQKGNTDRARHLMQQIAPLERAGYAPAHFWLARQMLSSNRPQDSDGNRQHLLAIEKHLLFVVEKQPENLATHELLGRVYLATKQWDPAAQHFAKTVAGNPALSLTLAKIYVMLGKKESAENQGEAAVEHYGSLLETNERDIEARLQLAAAQAFLKRFAVAEATLQRGLSVIEDERLRTALSNLYVNWFDRTDASRLRYRLELLQRALSYEPNSPSVLERLALFTEHEGAQAEEAMGILQTALARGDAPGMVHGILGTLASASGDHEKALFHLKHAFRAHPNMPDVANNLAWALAHADPPQLKQALGLINAALEALPDHPEFRDTRGVIYAKLSRFDEAITDLEAALNRMPDRVSTRENLATAYEKLGHSELAGEQRRIIKELRTKHGEVEEPKK